MCEPRPLPGVITFPYFLGFKSERFTVQYLSYLRYRNAISKTKTQNYPVAAPLHPLGGLQRPSDPHLINSRTSYARLRPPG